MPAKLVFQGTNVVSVVAVLLTAVCCVAAEEGPFSPGDKVVVTTEGARLVLKSRPVARLPKGTEVEVVKVEGDWVAGYASLGDQRKAGWVHRRDVAAPGGGTGCHWPQFHGPNRDNKSAETGLLKSWPANGPPLIWTARGIGAGFASVSIADGLIYTAGNVGGKTMVTALDLDGQTQWQSPNGDAWTGSYEGTRGTPTIDGDRLYHESPIGNVTCMDARSGKPVWTRNILEEFGSKNITWALAESVLVDGDRVISTPGGPQTAVVALDKDTGRTVWQSPSANGDLAGYSSPVVAEFGGLRMILQMTAKALIGVNADNGDLLFRYPHETKYDVNATSPIFKDGFVFITSNYGTGSELVKLDAAGGRVTARQAWEHRPLDNHHGGVVLLDGYLYGSSNRGWHCVGWENGQSAYQERGVGKGSLTFADGMLYTLSENHTMGLVEATPAGHELAGEFDLPEGGDGKSWAHPVVCGGRLYIRHGDFLYAYDVKAK